LLVVALLLACQLSGCATTGPQGQTSIILISTQEEITLGMSVDQNIRQEYPVYSADPELVAYVQEIGARVAAYSDRQDVAYTFTVLDSEVINAFAAPGGFIYITTGLLRSARNEAEVAGVLSHETGHVVGRHSVRRIQSAYGIALAADLLLGDRDTLQKIAQVATGVVLLKNGRDDEFEADEFSLKYNYAAGYDPRQIIGFFETLLELQGGASPAGMAGWFSTHPATEDRIAACQTLLQQYDLARPLEVNRARFLARTQALR